ncbi:MAG: branched-chain amino acid transaminase [Conexivisphaerales archaeon]
MRDKKEYIWFDGKILDAENAKITVKSHSLHYGTAVFEGIRAYKHGSKLHIFRLYEHMKRLLESARMIHIKVPYSSTELSDAVVELLRKNNYKRSLYIRPIVFLGDGGINLDFRKHPVHVAIFALPFDDYFEKKGLKVCISSWRRVTNSALIPRAKASANYLNSCIATIEAKMSGYDEAIMLDQNGYVSEGSGENIFLVKNSKLYTPGTYSSILEGITRDTVVNLAKDMGVEVNFTHLERSELYTADEVFLTGTAAEIAPVVEIDGRTIGDGNIGNITSKISEMYNLVVTGRNDKYKRWLTTI